MKDTKDARDLKVLWIVLAALVVSGAGVGGWLWLAGKEDHAKPAKAQKEVAPEHDHTKLADAEYTCPMHPQIVEKEPGECPICGMDLVKKETEADKPKPKTERKITHWVAPMDPSYVSDKPGKSPMGMDLVPVYAEDGGSGGTVLKIDPVVVQNMGVRIGRVKRSPLYLHIRTIGTVDVAETELSVVNLRYSGWIERIFVDETGVLVQKGQRLFSMYSPELVSAEEEYLLALRTGVDSPLAKSARMRLALWDLPEAQIREIAKEGKARRTITVVAPQKGYVLHKAVVQGARINAGVDLYRIGNLDKIWVNAEVYEFDAPWVKVGDVATMTLSFQGSETHKGKVTYVYPTLNTKTRTLTVRLEFDNPGLQLRPGSFATVQIEARPREDVLVVPTEAIIHTGARDIVFVALDLGRYEKREIISGLVGDRYLTEVRSGLREGERVVTSSQFLLDSESQMQEAVQKLLDARLHAKEKRVMGADDSSKTKESAGQKADSYWTCGMHPSVVEDGPGKCPICGMDLTEQKR